MRHASISLWQSSPVLPYVLKGDEAINHRSDYFLFFTLGANITRTHFRSQNVYLMLSSVFITVPLTIFTEFNVAGLDSRLAAYADNFLAAGVSGTQLLGMTNDDLYEIGIRKVGHQETLLNLINLLDSLVSLLGHKCFIGCKLRSRSTTDSALFLS